MQIVKTNDYSSFQLIMSNREVDPNHVRRLAKSISRKNLLYIRPLIVNDKMQLIDGQHRLAAAKSLGAEVFYIKVNGLTKADIAVLNTAQKNWTVSDFINFYAIEGNQHYKDLAALMDKYYWIVPSTIARIACGDSRSKLREGGARIQDVKAVHGFCEWLRTLEPNFPFVGSSCAIALFVALKTEAARKSFARAINEKNFYRCGSGSEYKKLIASITKTNQIKIAA